MIVYVAIGTLIAAISVAYTFNFALEFSAFAASIAKVMIEVALFLAFDHWVMRDIDTITELKNGNVAYGLFLVSLAVLFGAAMLGT